MKWIFAPARKAFEELRVRWDQINTARGSHLLLDSIFVDCALRHFADNSVVLGVKSDARQPGLGIFKRKSIGLWETFQPSQAPLGLMLFPKEIKEIDLPGEMNDLICSLPGYALQLSVLQQDPNYPMVSAALDGSLFETVNYIETACISLVGTFEEYWKGRGIKLRQNVGRRKRRLIEKGLIPEFVTLRDASDVADALKAYAKLESKGWKAQAGTAVTLDNPQGRFYKEIFQQFCQRREAIIYQLRVSGEVIATDLCLVRDNILILLKTTYDEDWNEYSPAILMREEIMKQLFAEGRVRRLEFYGRAMDWHRQWTDDIRTMYHINCFRHSWVQSLKTFRERVRPKKLAE